jgi:hypothetical protein
MFRKNFLLLNVILVIILFLGLLPLTHPRATLASDDGLQNLGFEQNFLYWDKGPVADAAVVVDSEGPADFQTYANKNITVDPYQGSYMLRLGTPKSLSQNQNRGENTVKQKFTPDGTSILFSFRLFSWEERGYDSFMFDVQDASGTSVNLPVRNPGTEDEPVTITIRGSPIYISQLPFKTSIDVGKQGDFLDTGWVEVEIYGLEPYTSTQLTLVYSVGGTNNEAHATWAYFDNMNRPPVAKFDFSPLEPWEGDIIEFIDHSYDPDEPNDAIVSWNWDIHWFEGTEGNDHGYSDLKNPLFIPANQGTYQVTLTVTDSFGATGTTSMPMNVGSDSPETGTINIGNAPPAVNALNIEVLAGQDADLFGRFIDPGWKDSHSASWSVDTVPLAATLQEDNLAFMSTGIVTGTLTAPGQPCEINGTLTVTDNSEDPGSDDFIITVINDDPERYESYNGSINNNTVNTAYPLTGDAVYLSYLQSIDDIDVFEVVSADGSPLPAGSEVLVTLKDLPADYDMVLLTLQPSELEPGGLQMGGLQMGGLQMGGLQMGGLQMGGLQMGGLQMGGLQMGGLQMGGLQMGGLQMGFSKPPYQIGGLQMGGLQMGGLLKGAYRTFGLQMGGLQMGAFKQYPLSQMGFTGVEALTQDNIGNTDISLTELGLSAEELGLENVEGQNYKVIGFSANHGQKDEVLLANIDVTGTRLFIVVAGDNGAYSSDLPYSLQIETSSSLDILQWLLSNHITFTYDPPVHSWNDDQDGPILYEYNGAPKTLFVTQKERIIGRYGGSEWEALLGVLTDPENGLANQDTIAGDIISIPISNYVNWDNNLSTTNDPDDTNYQSIDAANQVTLEIRNIIQEYLTQNSSIQYVVILGNDDIVPFHRVPDETGIGNEQDYGVSSFLKPGSPLFFSVTGGWIITDDYYIDENPIPWQGRSLYVPDLAISRLVEKPLEIIAAAEDFVASDGILNASTALVTGYDFFDDGAQAVADVLDNAGITPDTSLISGSWSADDLSSKFLDTGYDINNINAHCTHYSVLSANGFKTNNFNDVLTSIQAGTDDTSTVQSIVFSMGCHLGLNVPDEAAPSAADLGLDIDPQLDFAQALHRSICLASTGFGYGDDEGIGGTERLIGIFTDKLQLDNPAGTTVGEALVGAKQYYYSSTSPWTVYDEKSSIQFEMYGLPQYTVKHGEESSSLTSMGSETSSEDPSLDLTVEDGEAVYSRNPYLQLVPTSSGSYFTADGDSQDTAFRPVQPRVVVDDLPTIELPLEEGQLYPAHGVLLTGGQFQFFDEKGFDPVITRPTTDWELNVTEKQLLPPTFWPSELAFIKDLETGGQLVQTLVVIPGQFRPTDEEDDEVIGTERVFTNLSFEILRPETLELCEEGTPPVVNGVDLQVVEGGVNITVDTTDDVNRIVVLIIKQDESSSTGTITSYDFENPAGPMFVPDVGENDGIVIQVANLAGYVATYTAKGANMHAIKVDAGPDRGYTPGETEVFEATIPDFGDLTPPVFYIWYFGDGTTESGILDEDDITELNTFSVEHVYGEDTQWFITATLKIMDSDGGIGVDDVLLYRWWDPQGDANSLAAADLNNGYAVTDGEWVTIGIKVYGEISNDYQYRLRIDSEPGGTLHLRYSAGQVTGLSGLKCYVVEYNGSYKELRFMFRLTDAGFSIGDRLWLSAQTQKGVPSEPAKGIIDNMPDEGSVLWILR